MKKILPALLLLLSVAACTTKDAIKDCETYNYGVVHITYGGTANRHSIIANGPSASNVRDKITASGVSSDTLHLSPDTWTLSISSIDANGLAISQDVKTVTTTKCSDATETVTF